MGGLDSTLINRLYKMFNNFIDVAIYGSRNEILL